MIEKAVHFFGITLHNPLQQVRKALHKVNKSVPPSRLARHRISIREKIRTNQKLIQAQPHSGTIETKKNRGNEL